MKQSKIIIKLVTSCHNEVKSRHFALKSMLQILLFFIMAFRMQGLRVIKALASLGLYNSQILHHWASITNSGIYSLLYGKSCVLTSN